MQANSARKRQWIGPRRCEERVFECAVYGPRVGAKGEKTVAFFGAGELRHGVGGARRVGKQVEPLAFAPGVPGQDVGAVEGKVIGDGRAGVGEQPVEHPFHRQYGGAAIHGRVTDRDFAHFAARALCALDHGHSEAHGRQINRACETSYPSADNQNLVVRHTVLPEQVS